MRAVALLLGLIFLSFSYLNRISFKSNHSFIPKKVLFPLTTTTSVEDSPIVTILAQPFHYLAKGNESFVFLSSDQKWVLKLIRFDHFHEAAQPLTAFTQAYRDLSEETGLHYLHLENNLPLKTVKLIDPLLRQHNVPLSHLPFVLQKAGTPFFDALNKSPHPIRLIEKTLILYESLYNKGYINRDPIFKKNIGVIEESPFIMDIGKIEKYETIPSKREFLEKMTVSLKDHLVENNRPLYTDYKNLLQSILSPEKNAH